MYEEIKFDELMKPLPKFYIYGDTFDYKEELKAWGCYWIPEKKAWCIDCKENSTEISVIKSLPRLRVTKKID